LRIASGHDLLRVLDLDETGKTTMLRSIQLENFKAFGKRTIIPLAPITLIFGENSSGKSSILQSLNLMKQTRESRDVEALLLPRTDNGFVDLGSFQELLFDHQLDRKLQIRLDLSWENDSDRRRLSYRGFPQSNGIGLEMSFTRKSLKEEVSLDQIQLFDPSTQDCLARFDHTEMTKTLRRMTSMPFRPDRRISMSSLRAAKCSYVTKDPSLWMSAFEALQERKDKLIKVMGDLRSMTGIQKSDEESVSEIREDGFGSRFGRISLEALNRAIEFYQSDYGIDQFIERFHPQQLETVIALDGFIPVRGGSITNTPLPELVAHEILGRPSRLDWILDIGQIAASAGRAIEHTLTSLFPLGPFRTAPERWYIFTGTCPQDVGYRGHLLPDLLFRRGELVEDTNRWLEKLRIGYQIIMRPLGPEANDLFEVRLIDTRRSPPVDVALPDVGFGISQFLPFLVQSLAASDQIISIEQPEVHIHPRLQADLGDLLAQCIREPRQNQFIIETHSEHLALRLQRLVREKTLTPSDISIVYVSRGPNGSTVQPLRLDEEGDFMDEFPGGFFPERLRELR
jgi:AAA ATPase domain